jgi:F-type H+-transporting ATPase subunit delta
MGDLSVARKYAAALFQLASEGGVAAKVRGDLESIAKLMCESHRLVSFLESPDVAQKEKMAFLDRAFKGRVEETMLPFLFLLSKRDRLGLLPDILAEFEKLDEQKSGVQRAEVVTAVPLSPRERELILSRLMRITGKKILLRDRVDPTIIGGVVVYVNGDVIDGSIRAQLAELKSALLAAPVAR